MRRGNAALARESASDDQRRDCRNRHTELFQEDVEEDQRYTVANDEIEQPDHSAILAAKQPEQQGEDDREQN